MTLWKIACQEDVYPGMWQRWFKNQCAAVGWASKWGFKLNGSTEGGRGWSAARNALKEIEVGDYVVVALRGHRIGRIGQVTEKAVEDDDWAPLVPPGPGLPDGEMGRRINVRWDLTIGPDNHDLVIQLPKGRTFSSGELRPTIARIRSLSLDSLVQEMRDPANWVSLLGNFRYERALSDFIANYPNRLEDGLLAHPNSKIRERVFKDKTRLDVLLLDRDETPVIVECKQHAPTPQDLKQIRHYMALLERETGKKPRGILVHGGAGRLHSSVESIAQQAPVVEIVNYSLEVVFRNSVRG